jgi:hypothetical protein
MPATDIALKRYSAKKFNLNKTKVYGNRRQIRVATLIISKYFVGKKDKRFVDILTSLLKKKDK